MSFNRSKVNLNVSGEIFETREKTLQFYPETLLGDRNKRYNYYCGITEQYFFNRNRKCFDAILFFYQSKGKLYLPLDITLADFVDECNFFQLPEDSINKLKIREKCLIIDKRNFQPDIVQSSMRIKLWKFMENSITSYTAQSFALFRLFMIAISMTTTCLETVPHLQTIHGTTMRTSWSSLELIINTWFLIELLIRSVLVPSKFSFVKSWLNWIDIFAVVPFFIGLALNRTFQLFDFFRILRFFRMAYLLRSRSVDVAILIIKALAPDLLQLLLILVMMTLMGGSLIYYLEEESDYKYVPSIPEGLWWAIQTITTVGYGDVVPTTINGKLFAVSFLVGGVVTIALPVLSIANQFVSYYENNL